MPLNKFPNSVFQKVGLLPTAKAYDDNNYNEKDDDHLNFLGKLDSPNATPYNYKVSFESNPSPTNYQSFGHYEKTMETPFQAKYRMESNRFTKAMEASSKRLVRKIIDRKGNMLFSKPFHGKIARFM